MVIRPKGNEKTEEVERNLLVLSLLKSEISLIFAEVINDNISRTMKTREEALQRLKKAKAIKAQAVEKAKKELADIVEKKTGVRPQNSASERHNFS
jgi:ribosome-binding ATPase YchF (GTP1/OBG family)